MSSLTDTATRRKKRGLALRHRRDPDLQRPPARPNKHRQTVERAEPQPEPLSPVKARQELPSWFWTLIELLLLAGLIFCLFRIGQRIHTLQQLREDLSLVSEDLDRKTAALEEKTREATLEVRYLIPGQEDLVEDILYGDTAVLREGPELPGYTFLYWEDREGKPEDRQVFPVYRDTVYTARYALAFESDKHIPYLSTDTEGVLNLSGTVSIREFVNILYLLLDLDRVGDGRFLDVAENDPCFKAAATLKELGALEGSRLFPDEPLTRGEMLKTLCHFFPVTREQHVFQDMDSD